MFWGVLLAALGGFLFYKMKMPAGAMIGSMIFVAVFNIFTGEAYFPAESKVLSQAVAGAFIGMGMTRELFRGLRALLKAALMVTVVMQVTGLTIGMVFYRITGFDIKTALLSCSPGGIVDMTLISMDMGADTAIVAAVHTIRLLVVVSVFPPLMKFVAKRFERRPVPAGTAGEALQPAFGTDGAESSPPPKQELPLNILLRLNFTTFLVAIAGGTVGYITNIPAGIILFSLASVAVYNLLGRRAYMSRGVRTCAQVLAGGLVGQSMGMDEVRRLQTLCVPVLVVIGGFILFSLLLGIALHIWTKLEITTSLFACIPAGAADMALIAMDLGGDGPQVGLLQIVRLVTVIAVYPQLVHLIDLLI